MSSLEEPSAKIPKIELKNDEELDEGHEEWLSEDILTDDDYNASNAPHLNSTQANAASSMDVDAAHQMENSVQNPNDLEKSQETDLPGELSTFLVRKKDVRSDAKRPSDGNDTDELLSMLGDDDHSKVSGSRREIKNDSSDDDDYIFDGAKVSHLKVASNAIMKKMPSRAIPEDSDRDSDMSSDERQTVKKMFGVARGGISNVASKSTAKSSLIAMRDMMNLNIAMKSKTQKETPKAIEKNVPEIIDEEEYLDEEQFDLDEGMESVVGHQRIMRPERMDEEVPTDGDSEPDDESLYDELPSSDSEDMTEWFTLDLRAERAGDYIPLLGPSARRLLSTERARAAARLSALKQNAAALNESSAGQAAALRRAARQLQELDAALRA